MPDLQERWEEPGAEYAPPCTAASVAGTAVMGISAAKGTAEQPGRVKRFLPFSTGTRDCVGQTLARMNYTTTVAMLLAHFKFRLADEVVPIPLSLTRACTDLRQPPLATTQAGGLEGVLASQSSALTTLQPSRGLLMHCVPRMRKPSDVLADSLCVMPTPLSRTLPCHRTLQALC